MIGASGSVVDNPRRRRANTTVQVSHAKVGLTGQLWSLPRIRRKPAVLSTTLRDRHWSPAVCTGWRTTLVPENQVFRRHAGYLRSTRPGVLDLDRRRSIPGQNPSRRLPEGNEQLTVGSGRRDPRTGRSRGIPRPSE
jgi:hypothetical protein